MTKYQCDACKHVFLHPAKIIKPFFPDTLSSSVGSILNASIEVHVCPYCNAINLTEYTEPQPEITSVKSVDLAQVDDFLKQGYTVKELYAKTATLIKSEIKKEAQTEVASAFVKLCKYWQSAQCGSQGSTGACGNQGQGCEVFIALESGVKS